MYRYMCIVCIHTYFKQCRSAEYREYVCVCVHNFVYTSVEREIGLVCTIRSVLFISNLIMVNSANKWINHRK